MRGAGGGAAAAQLDAGNEAALVANAARLNLPDGWRQRKRLFRGLLVQIPPEMTGLPRTRRPFTTGANLS